MRHMRAPLIAVLVVLIGKDLHASAEGFKWSTQRREAWLTRLRELDPNIVTDPDEIAASESEQKPHRRMMHPSA